MIKKTNSILTLSIFTKNIANRTKSISGKNCRNPNMINILKTTAIRPKSIWIRSATLLLCLNSGIFAQTHHAQILVFLHELTMHKFWYFCTNLQCLNSGILAWTYHVQILELLHELTMLKFWYLCTNLPGLNSGIFAQTYFV